jgi:TonB-dependent receptor
MGVNVISTTTLPNFMEGAGGSFPKTLVLLNTAQLIKGLESLNGTPNYTNGSGVYDFSQTLPQFNATNSYAVSEKTLDAYAEATFAATNWTGNLGVRVVQTNTLASTAVNNILSVTVADTTNPTNPGIVQYSPTTPVSAKGSYLMPLPSVNLNYHITPKLQLRLGGAEVLTRPDLNQLVPTATNNALNQQYVLTYGGNASLKPITAWQADTSLEWYYRPRALFAVAVFGKWLKNDITTVQINGVDIGAQGCFNGQPCQSLPFDIIKPVNGDTAQVYGVEISWQQILQNGFGANAQFTHNWSQTIVDGVKAGPENGVSPTTFSVGLLYESGPISANVSYQYSSSFTYASSTEVTGYPAISTDSDWLTATASYQLNKQVKIYVEGKNLTNSIVRTYLNGNSYATWASGSTSTGNSVDAGYSAFGRTITAGVGMRF